MNGAVLSGNDPIDQIPNGNNSKNFVALQHRQVTQPVRGHQPHAFFNGMRRPHMNDFSGKNFFDRSLLRGFSFERDFARVIAFGQDPDQLCPFRYQQSAYIFVGHHLDRFEHRGIRRNTPDPRSFLMQNFAYGAGGNHENRNLSSNLENSPR